MQDLFATIAMLLKDGYNVKFITNGSTDACCVELTKNNDTIGTTFSLGNISRDVIAGKASVVYEKQLVKLLLDKKVDLDWLRMEVE